MQCLRRLWCSKYLAWCIAVTSASSLRVGFVGERNGLTYYTGLQDALTNWVELHSCGFGNIETCKFGSSKLDAGVVGFSSADTRPWNTTKLRQAAKRLGCFINKEYRQLQTKLELTRSRQCDIGFSAHHNISFYSNISKVSFRQCPFGVDPAAFGTVSLRCALAAAESYDPRDSEPIRSATERFNESRAVSVGCPAAISKGEPDLYEHDFGFSGNVHSPNQASPWRGIVAKNPDRFRALGLRMYLPKSREINLRGGKIFSFAGGQGSLASYIQLLRSSKMWLSTPSPANLVGTRYFEILATGTTLLVTPKNNQVEGLFGPPGWHYIAFETLEELDQLLKYYKSHEAERMAIVRRAQLHVLAAHSWHVRARQLVYDLVGEVPTLNAPTSTAGTELQRRPPAGCGKCSPEAVNGSVQLVIFHSWHKTGTFMLQDLAEHIVAPLCNLRLIPLTGDKPCPWDKCVVIRAPLPRVDSVVHHFPSEGRRSLFVYVLRDPVAITVSMWGFHRTGMECGKRSFGDRTVGAMMGSWNPHLHSHELCSTLATLPPRQGVLEIASRLIIHQFPQMVRVHDRLRREPRAYAARFEELNKPGSTIFETASTKLLRFLGVPQPSTAMKHLNHVLGDMRKDQHVNPLNMSDDEKSGYYDALGNSKHCISLRGFRNSLDYQDQAAMMHCDETSIPTKQSLAVSTTSRDQVNSTSRLATITLLITKMIYLQQWKTSLPLLYKNWISRFPLPVTVFYGGHVEEKNVAGVVLEVAPLVDVRFWPLGEPEYPPYVHDMVTGGKCVCCCNGLTRAARGMKGARYDIGYCYMNRFRTLLMYRHQALDAFDYFVQLDTDTYIMEPLPYDPVAVMYEKRYVFGFLFRKIRKASPSDDCILGMNASIYDFFVREHLILRFVPTPGVQYVGNFNIGDLHFLRSESYFRFASFINNERTGIFAARWGDQAFLPYILAAYFDERSVHEFEDLRATKVIVHRSQSMSKIS